MAGLNDKVSALPGVAKAAVAAGLLVVGGAVGAGVAHHERPSIEMAPIALTPIAKLASADGIVTVKGRVAESFGDSFVLADASGRTLIRAGRRVEAPAVGSTVSVQGRADDGALRPSFLVDTSGKVSALRGGRGHGRHRGPDREGPPPAPPQPAVQSDTKPAG